MERRKLAKKSAGFKGMAAAVIGLSIALVIALAVLPIALEDAAAATTANWGAAGVALLALLGLVAAAGLLFFVLRSFDIV